MLELELTTNQPSNATIKRGLRREANILEDSDFGITNKEEIKKMADFSNKKKKVSRKVKSMQAPKLDASDIISAGIFEYKMPQTLADIILKNDKTKRPHQEILCEFVNTQYGLKGYCVRVLLN